MQILIEDIMIKDRVRTEMGDLKSLMESMRLHGQLNPITISRENELIAGHRRTLAARELGWKYIEAHVIDSASEAEKLQMELEENVHRKDFSPEELLVGYKRLDKLLHPSFGQRIGSAIKNFFLRIFRRRKTPQPPMEPVQPTAQPDTARQAIPENRPSAENASEVIGSQFGV